MGPVHPNLEQQNQDTKVFCGRKWVLSIQIWNSRIKTQGSFVDESGSCPSKFGTAESRHKGVLWMKVGPVHLHLEQQNQDTREFCGRKWVLSIQIWNSRIKTQGSFVDESGSCPSTFGTAESRHKGVLWTKAGPVHLNLEQQNQDTRELISARNT